MSKITKTSEGDKLPSKEHTDVGLTILTAVDHLGCRRFSQETDHDPSFLWHSNSEFEFALILIEHYPYVSMDSKFPGVVFRLGIPIIHYKTLKTNTTPSCSFRLTSPSQTPTEISSILAPLITASYGIQLLRL
ncbi:hypothetical protein ACH5RR_033146 [Cinchona calisaya]|uniref:Uncharacterized protein n=1 Tax=Cinchona calisaya TaxID=153742 RepID=A0ABD2YK43_9GENT